MQYELRPENLALGDIFSKLEGQEARSQLAIDDFSVNQNNLDNVSIANKRIAHVHGQMS